jgi:hypothetical protein
VSAECSFYQAHRELTRQNEANLIRMAEKRMVEYLVKAPMPGHPCCENRPQPAPNELNRQAPSRPADAEFALRL